MVAVLACQSCYPGNLDLINRRRALNILGFSSSMSNQQFPRLEGKTSNLPANKLSRFQVEARESGSNGRTIKTVPTSKVMKRKTPSVGNAEVTNPRLNGNKVRPIKMVPKGEVTKRKAPSVGNAAVMTGSKGAVNGVSNVNKSPAPQLVKTQKISDSKGFPTVEDLRVLAWDEGFSWAIENYSPFQRTIDVWFFVVSLYIRVLFDNATWTYFGGFTEDKQKHKRRRTASWLRVRTLQLGPTFIKLGQFASTRTDLLPREFVDELAKLQDRVPAFSPKKAKDFIANELGAPIDILFKEFEDWPIAAASLGQVHRAILHNGEKVIVKVQRPDLKKIFDIDLRNIKLITEYFHRSETFGDLTTDWIGIYEESARILYEEIDYINEGKNADRFRRDFRNVKWVRVPLVIWDYTTTKVLTMEYVPGIKINDLDKINAQGYSRSQISSRAVKAYLIQILRTGFFHADPHPGNLAIDVDESLIYYDFGMMGEIQPFTQERLLNLCYAVYEKDVNKVIRNLIDLGALQPTSDPSSSKRYLQGFLDNLLRQTSDQQQTFSAIGEDLFSIAQDLSFQFPSTVTFVMKAFSTLEGIGYTLDPGFSFVKIAAAFAQELLDLKDMQSGGRQLVDEIRKQAEDARRYTVSMPYKIHQIEEFVEQLESGDLKLRVHVLESERAAQKSAILQMATIFTLLGSTLVNLGVTFSNSGTKVTADGSFIGAGVFLVLVIRSMGRVKQLDKIKRIS